jgi:hypothetical protein
MDIADIGWLEDIQDAINLANDALQGLFALYVLTIILIVLSIITNFIASFAQTSMLAIVNLTSFALATLSLIVSSILVTVALTRGINALNDIGEDFGIYGERGNNFLVLTWIASGLMISATIFTLIYLLECARAT